jgi:hypothetical protein
MEYRMERARLYRRSAEDLRAKAKDPDVKGKPLGDGLILMARHYESMAGELEQSVQINPPAEVSGSSTS